MTIRKKQKEKINFLLQNKHYQKLQLFLYLISLMLIVLVYFLTIILFSSYSPNYLITGIFSIIIGFYLVFNRDKLVIKISEYIENKKRKKMKIEKKEGLQNTLKKITPKKNRIKLNIKSKLTVKEKIQEIKKKIKTKKKNKNSPEYIEIK